MLFTFSKKLFACRGSPRAGDFEIYASIAVQLVVTKPPPAPNVVSVMPAARSTLSKTVLAFSAVVER
jgi:hypothetical protein